MEDFFDKKGNKMNQANGVKDKKFLPFKISQALGFRHKIAGFILLFCLFTGSFFIWFPFDWLGSASVSASSSSVAVAVSSESLDDMFLAQAGQATPSPATFSGEKLDDSDINAPISKLSRAYPILGDRNAKITLVEYASLTCSHCAHFEKTTFDYLESEYIEKGLVRYQIRPFPLDAFALSAAMIAICDAKDYYPLSGYILKNLEAWAFTDKPIDNLFTLLKKKAKTRDYLLGCLKNEQLLSKVKESFLFASKNGVNSTPTFFLNGRRIEGVIDPQQLDEEIAKETANLSK